MPSRHPGGHAGATSVPRVADGIRRQDGAVLLVGTDPVRLGLSGSRCGTPRSEGPGAVACLLGRGQATEQLAHVGALLEQRADLRPGAALRLEDGDPLQAGPARHVEDH